ncbi:hypothetical protein I316_06106 [Kwoniella heveanensis BCC8398]|uniref:Uncharacterized protein n=1 Tax=Kwoniella heveanensis BCC8398 TaxID=1296120 RepID=A0A1B9GMF5_9TREE|nr:hypothetical protein I316_06106 [Kwoniella heveanensis BCC8398]
MPRHAIHPLSRAFNPSASSAGAAAGPGGGGYGGRGARRRSDEGMWKTLDRLQVLGEEDGHTGCVNALSWSDDGKTLLSGSDDTRICIWQPDPHPASSSSSSFSSSSTTRSPHPLKLTETIQTGHRANIFSAKFLPNASTPTVVSCAGDRDVRVMEVERLVRNSASGELDGSSGDGVTILRCHKDRTKRISTENSPYLFLTVSEDGTVRQHDLRRPHTCRSECPDPLFYAPRGVDLYSLSVSTVTPHMFTVAGRTDCAFVCDRRMLPRQTPSWGPHVRSSGQVHCVRRLGLPDEEWDKVSPRSGDRMFGDERHITCVRMSPEHADEVAVAFARHSTSLFSIYDSPPSESMRATSSSPTIVPSNEENKKRKDNSSSPSRRSGKAISVTASDEPVSRQRTRSPLENHGGPSNSHSAAHTVETTWPFGQAQQPGLHKALLGQKGEPSGRREDRIGPDTPPTWSRYRAENFLRDDSGEESEDPEPSLSDLEEMALDYLDRTGDLDLDEDEDEEEEEEEDHDNESEFMSLDEEDEIDFDDFGEDDDEDGENDDEDVDMDPDVGILGFGGSNASRLEAGAFDKVEKVLPRRSFRGARNVETVKDCNFLGIRADKICSGSDDGNFFVWDKDTGRLEGIWEGDGSVVNVVEQHPTLPLIACSGIDSTVKIFGPAPTPIVPSFNKTHLAQTITERNTRLPRFLSGGAFERATLLQFLMTRGLVARVGDNLPGVADEDGEIGEGGQGCETQ